MVKKKSMSFGVGGARGHDDASPDKEEESLAEMDLSAYAASAGESAQGAAVSGLFRYDLRDPVTVPDRSSTLVSFVNEAIDGEDVLLYRPEQGGKAHAHPYRSIRFRNDTGYVLQGGPVTIFSGGTFVGEGIFDRIESTAETFLPYSMDTSLAVTRHVDHAEKPLRLIRMVDGMLLCEIARVKKTKYEVISRAEPEGRLYVRHAKRSGWKLEGAPDDTRELAGSWYVPFALEKGKTTFTVEERTPTQRRVTLTSRLGHEVLALFLSDAEADPELKASMGALQTLHAELTEVKAQVREAKRKRKDLTQQQARLRANIESLGKTRTNAALRRDLGKKLGVYEQQIDVLNGEIVKLDEQRVGLEARLREAVRQLSIDPPHTGSDSN